MKTKKILALSSVFIFLTIIFSCYKGKDRSCKDCGEKNKSPIANAGTGITITLPLNVTALDGSRSNDPDGHIVTYKWTRIEGPSLSTIDNEDSAITMINNLMHAIYQYELKVTDNGGLSSKDTVQIIVNPQLLLNEIIITDLVWHLWVDQGAPGLFDEIYLYVGDTSNRIPDIATPGFSVFVKRDTTSSWEPASSTLVNGNCTAPFWYILSPTALLIQLCSPFDYGLVGRKASVKIRF